MRKPNASTVLALLGIVVMVAGIVQNPATQSAGSNRSPQGEERSSANPGRPSEVGRGDRPETGLQGQTPFEDVMSGRSQQPYYEGTRLVGHTDIWNRGANWQMAWVGKCAYVATLKQQINAPNSERPLSLQEPAGVAVIDVRNPRNPRPVDVLREDGAIDAVETMHAMDAGDRQVLVAGNYQGQPDRAHPMDRAVMDVYDVSDCTRPKHMSSFEWPHNAHNLTISPDGRHVYGTSTTGGRRTGGQGIMVADISDMANPELIFDGPVTNPDGTTEAPTVHEVSLSTDGTRVYAAAGGAFNPGVAYILDNSDIREGVEDPELRVIGRAVGGGGHSVWPANIDGVPHLVGAPELGRCPGTWPRITDISDEENPEVVGEFKLEMNEEENCATTELGARETIDIGNIASHYNDVDDPEDTRLGLFPFVAGGLRIADLTDPTNPVEVAYYKPGANPGTFLNARGTHWSTHGDRGFAYYNDQAVDACGSHTRYVPETGHIWFVCQSNGFFVIELTPDVREQVGLPALPGNRP